MPMDSGCPGAALRVTVPVPQKQGRHQKPAANHPRRRSQTLTSSSRTHSEHETFPVAQDWDIANGGLTRGEIKLVITARTIYLGILIRYLVSSGSFWMWRVPPT
jgi:hypothetical protein